MSAWTTPAMESMPPEGVTWISQRTGPVRSVVSACPVPAANPAAASPAPMRPAVAVVLMRLNMGVVSGWRGGRRSAGRVAPFRPPRLTIDALRAGLDEGRHVAGPGLD